MNYLYQEKLDIEKGTGLVLGCFAPLHKGHLDLIYRAKKENLGGVFVIVCGYDGDRGEEAGMNLKARYQMVREYFKDDPLVAVYCISDNEAGIAGYTDHWTEWLQFLEDKCLTANQVIEDARGLSKKITFYVSEKDYYDHLLVEDHKAILCDRTVRPISGTLIRSNPLKYWDDMAWTYHRVFSHNILITGTASEGKTTLVEDVGRFFNMSYSFEWAREYIAKHCIGDDEFNTTDFLAFLNGQFNYNRECVESRLNKGIFISDTDGIVTKMYAKYYALDPEMDMSMDDYEKVIEPAADAFAKKSRWDKVFVVVPHGVFVDDHTRYMKHGTMEARQELLAILMEELEKAGLKDKIEILDGGYLNNFNRVKEYIEDLQNKINS